MPDTRVIANTSPLLYLHQVGCLDVLQQLYSTIVVPPAVRQELDTGRKQGVDVPDVGGLPWIVIQPVASAALVPVVVDLGQGEAEVIALGLERGGSLLILDDQLARRIADLHRLQYTGTLGVLVKARQAGFISSIGAVIAALRQKGMWLSDAIVEHSLRLSGERP
jgi:predicted nucleic acid-binding protein